MNRRQLVEDLSSRVAALTTAAADIDTLERAKTHVNNIIALLVDSTAAHPAHPGPVATGTEFDFLVSLRDIGSGENLPSAMARYLDQCLTSRHDEAGQPDGTTETIAGVATFQHGQRFRDVVCPNAFLYVELRQNGDVSPCCYLPFAIGNIDRQCLEEIWCSPQARELRRSILDGSFRYCDAAKCAGMQKIRLGWHRRTSAYQVPYELMTEPELEAYGFRDLAGPSPQGRVPAIVSFDDDPSCNLTCPSCRTESQVLTRLQSDRISEHHRQILGAIPLGIRELWFAGAGDPLASRAYRRIFAEGGLERHPDLSIRLDTNGTLLTTEAMDGILGPIWPQIKVIAVSVDAVAATTYRAIRKGGNFDILMRNLKALAAPQRRQKRTLVLRMIVQEGNFKEMGDFVDLGIDLGVDRVVFSGIANWGTFDEEGFQRICVHSADATHHNDFLKALRDPRLRDTHVDMGNLTRLHRQVLDQGPATRTATVAPPPSAPVLLPNGKRALAVAFYLPQFHPIPENDAWWGKGFTEWTNVAKARPLFEGHRQPILPADLGFYDLRVAETRKQQAELARHYGLDAFCYWHYWFAGKRLIERPFQEVVRSGEPDFPFCLGWANQTWSGIWHGAPDRILIEQTYPGEADYRAHFKALLPAFRDPRYFRVGGRPLFVIYAPQNLPDARIFTSLWQELAAEAGLGEFHFVAHSVRNPRTYGCQSCVDNAPFVDMNARDLAPPSGEKRSEPKRHRYEDLVQYLRHYRLGPDEYPLVVPNWDNTPRSGVNGLMLQGSTPELFSTMLNDAICKVEASAVPGRRIVFIKAWNEWAEGNHLEPDVLHGHGYLRVLRETILDGPVDFSLKN